MIAKAANVNAIHAHARLTRPRHTTPPPAAPSLSGLNSDHIQGPPPAVHAAAMLRYGQTGKQLATQLGNRGPLCLTESGQLAPDIVAAYRKFGCYVFEGVIEPAELQALRRGVSAMLARAPVQRGARVDSNGQPAQGEEFQRETYGWIRPLSDPIGGSQHIQGFMHPRMQQPQPPANAPDHIISMMFGMCQTMGAGLRLYGHPELLAAAETLNGSDFTPFNDAVVLKQAHLGGSVAWHQDGMTHWQAANWNEDIHGLNFQVQLYPTTPANALWVLPGSHKSGKVNINAMVQANGGSDRLPGAVPLLCDAGDVTLVNRQLVHGSFANSSADQRVSITFGFHQRSAVGGYSSERIFKRSSVIAVATDARARHYVHEPRFRYAPFIGLEDQFRLSRRTLESVIKNYNLDDLSS